MKHWDMNTVIAWGLVIMGILSIIGWGLLSYKSGGSIGTEIPIGIISGLVGVLTGKNMAERKIENNSKASETLGKVATVAEEGKKIVDAVESIKELGKKA